MKKLTITSILALCMVCPAMADIAKNAQSATCDSSTIGTTTGPANLQADWTANTINLDFYSNDTKVGAGSCTYDGGITLPNTPEVPTGYTFGGWKVRAAPAQTTFNLATLSSVIDSPVTFLVGKGQGVNNSPYCEGWDTNITSNDGWFGQDERNADCSDSRFSGLNPGEWTTTASYGTVKGQAICSRISGTYAQTGTPTDETGQEGAQYCWCKATGFAEPNSSSYQTVASSSWVFSPDYDDAVGCVFDCAYRCADYVRDGPDFRRAVFGITQ